MYGLYSRAAYDGTRTVIKLGKKSYLISVWINISFMGAEGVVDGRGTLPRDMRRYNRHVVMIKMGIKASIVQTVTIFAKAGNVLLRPG